MPMIPTDRQRVLRALEHDLNWAGIDALANTPDYELAEKMRNAPYLMQAIESLMAEEYERIAAILKRALIGVDRDVADRILRSL